MRLGGGGGSCEGNNLCLPNGISHGPECSQDVDFILGRGGESLRLQKSFSHSYSFIVTAI